MEIRPQAEGHHLQVGWAHHLAAGGAQEEGELCKDKEELYGMTLLISVS